MKSHRNNYGFGAVGLIIIAFSISVIAIVIWRIQAANTSTADYSTATNEGSSLKLIKLGIQFAPPNSLDTLTFIESESIRDTSISDGYGSKTYPIVLFSLASLDNDPNCKLSTSGGQLGSLWKIPGQYPSDPNDTNTPGNLVKQFPEYYLAYRKPGLFCTSDTTQMANISKARNDLFHSLSATSNQL